MNRRHRAVMALVIALPLFAAPLVSPVPNYDAHLKMDAESINRSTMEEREKWMENTTTVHYQNLSVPAQRLFDRVNKHNGSDDIMLPLTEVPKPWSTSVPKSGDYDRDIVYVHKDDQYYLMDIQRLTPGPSLQAFMLRLGPLLGAIGLGTLAGYFVLTAED